MAVALDSSVVVGFLDRSDRLHHAADAAIRELLAIQPFVVSAITYAEVLAGARLGHHEEAAVIGFFDDLVSAILPVDREVADRAATLRAADRAVALPDALIAAGAELATEVELLLSGDRGLARLKGLRCRVRLLGPKG